MQELKNYLSARIEHIEKEIRLEKNKAENIKTKETLLSVLFLINLMEKYDINSKSLLEIITVETATDSSQVRLFDDCDTENQEYWKILDKVRLSRGDIIIKRKF